MDFIYSLKDKDSKQAYIFREGDGQGQGTCNLFLQQTVSIISILQACKDYGSALTLGGMISTPFQTFFSFGLK